ncbi:MAG: hypothetical protein KGI38_01445 [Thaumarchaeota archaeon]|nr:hypothetical protein [Nitrososphaerota archaeon]
MRRVRVFAAGLAIFVLVLSVSFSVPAASASPGLSLVSSGKLAQDSLTTGQTSYWYFGGDAVTEGAPHSYYEDSQGLHLGVQSPLSGVWAGFYAESPDTNGMLFHTLLTLPYTSLSSESFNTGLYVQTSSNNVNYITCAASADSTGYSWSVLYTTGLPTNAVVFTTVYSQANSGPLTRDCTIITNGNNFLEVYLGGQLVYSSHTLSLNMPPPFDSYLEVQTTNSQSQHFASYANYYATKSQNVNLTNGPPGGTMVIADSAGHVLGQATISRSGSASVDIGSYALPVAGKVSVYYSNGSLDSSYSGQIWGGDVYGFVANPNQTYSLTVNSKSPSGELDGMWTVLYDSNGNQIATGYTPIAFSGLKAGATYSVSVSDYGPYVFSHWEDGSTNSYRTFVANSNLAFTAYYN